MQQPMSLCQQSGLTALPQPTRDHGTPTLPSATHVAHLPTSKPSTAPGRQRRWMVATNNIELADSHADEFAVDEMGSTTVWGPHDARTSIALQRRILPAPARCMHSQTAITWTARANLTRRLAITNLTYRSLDAGAIMAVARPGAWIKPAPPPAPPPPPKLEAVPGGLSPLLVIPADPPPPLPPDLLGFWPPCAGDAGPGDSCPGSPVPLPMPTPAPPCPPPPPLANSKPAPVSDVASRTIIPPDPPPPPPALAAGPPDPPAPDALIWPFT